MDPTRLRLPTFVICIGVSGGLMLACQSATNRQTTLVFAVAAAANAAMPMAVGEYKRAAAEQLAKARTPAEIDNAMGALDKRWRPLWAAWKVFASAYGTWADGFAANREPPIAAVTGSYCDLLHRVPADLPIQPVAPLRCEPTSSEAQTER